jgi:pyrroline-5-carboxylate reductase
VTALAPGLRLGIVGAGSMGRALLRGILLSGTAPAQVWAITKSTESAGAVASEFGIATGTESTAFAAGSDAVLLAVKPIQLEGAGRALNDAGLRGAALVISVAAGTSTKSLEQRFGGSQPIVRAMPNTPAFVGVGMTAIAAGAYATPEHLALARELFTAVGRCVVLEERHMNAVTAISGSGPAYIYLIIEALADAGVRVGLPRQVALELVTQTVLGAATMVQQSDRNPAALKDDVTTPAGCTIGALLVLEDGKLRAVLARAVEEAYGILNNLEKK